MIAGARYVLWQKRAGVLSMILLVGALLSLADSLVGGIGGSRGVIELTPGSSYSISGPMPPRTEAIKDFVLDGQPKDGSIRLVPESIFSGYWFGGSMWRGLIVVEPSAVQGSFVLSVRDKFGEKQNPSLVFKVRVWPDVATLNANSASFLTRQTGYSPYLFAVGLALGGFLAGGANFILGRLWARHLTAHDCGEIYKLRRTKRGTEVTCELPCGGELRPGMKGAVYRPWGDFLCPATVASCDGGEVLLLVDAPELVRLGDVACVSSETKEVASS